MEQTPLITGDAGSVTITLSFGFWVLAVAGLIAVLSLAVYGLASSGVMRSNAPGQSRWPALPPLLAKIGLDALPRPLAWFSAVLWAVLFTAFVIGMLYVIGSLLLLGREEIRKDPGDLRWYLLTLTALTAALGAVVSLPFTLLRTGFNARQTLATEEGLVTDRINAAVESLGAEKTVNQIGRGVTFVTGHWDDPHDHIPRPTRTEIEWQGTELDPDEGEFLSKRGNWQVFSESLPNLEVRIGAILALERIARKTDDVHVQVMQILTAYIRENAKAADALPVPDMPDQPTEHTEEAWTKWRKVVSQVLTDFKDRLEPRTDIQTALDVLGRRTAKQRRIEAAWQDAAPEAEVVFDAPYPDGGGYPEVWSSAAHDGWWDRFKAERDARNQAYRDDTGYRLDLRGTNLQGYDMAGGCWLAARFDSAQMQGASLLDAQMQGARLVDAQMQGASLLDAQMQGARLGDAQMQGADLGGAQMQGASLVHAQMQGARLLRAQMQGANLWGAQMQGADLGDAQMQGANLVGAQMQGADLGGAQMQGANLWGAQMQGADLGDAQMQGASLGDAQMQGADLWGAQMQGADLGDAQMQGASLGDAQMQGADLGDAQMQHVWLFGTVFDTATSLNPATFRGAGLRDVDYTKLSIKPEVLQDTFGDISAKLPFDDPPDGWETKKKLDIGEFIERLRAFQVELGDATEE